MPVLENPERLAELRRTQLLDSPPEESFDRLTRLASRLLNVPVALVTLVDEDRQFFKSQQGLPEPLASTRQTPLLYSICQHVVASGEPLIIPDAHTHPLLRENPAVSRLQITAYAGIPLTTGEGQVLGSFCVADHQPRQWTPEEIQLLQDLSASAITEIECRLQADEVERYRRILQRFRAPLAELRDHLDTLSRAIARSQDEQIRHFVQPAITRVEQLKKIEGELADIAPRPDRDPQSAASTTDLRAVSRSRWRWRRSLRRITRSGSTSRELRCGSAAMPPRSRRRC